MEQAALRPEEKLLPAFRVAFESGALIERYKAGEEKEVKFLVHNYGKEIAEDVCIMVFFPHDFEVKKRAGYHVVKQKPVGTRYPNYNAAEFVYKLIHVEVRMDIGPVLLKMPEKPGNYQIPVAIRARKIGLSDYQLTIEIVS